MSLISHQVIALFDPPVTLDASVTPIPGSASSTLQVVANLPSNVNRIRFLDGIGEFVGVYSGSIGQEVLRAVIGGGVGETDVTFAAHSRVSLRSLESSTITYGKLCVLFLGFRTSLS
jgi:hypothetical protein